MKAFITLIIVAAGAWAGYTYWWKPSQAETVEQQAGDPVVVAPDGTQADAAANPFATVEGQPEAAPDNGVAPSPFANPDPADTDPATLAPALQALKDKADAAWAVHEQAKRDPTTANDAPQIAAWYSQVLRGTYGKDALAGMANELVTTRLTPLGNRLFFSPTPYLKDDSGLFTTHIIQEGENLDGIGRKYGMSYELINMMRGADPESGLYHPNDRLKVVNVKQSGYWLHVDKSDFRMDVYVGGVFARRYPVGIGEDVTPTPAGVTHITARVKYPQWTNPKTGEVIDYGQPGHILGPIWLAFDSKLGRNGLGIHGYTGADGRATLVKASNGCIRMENDQALELYNIMVKCGMYQSGFISRAPMNVKVVE